MGGGILLQGITEIAGQSGAGKTQFALQLAITAQLTHGYGGLDSGMQLEQATWQRYPELNGMTFADGIFVEHADSVEQLWQTVSQRVPLLLASGRVRLIIIDSVAALFRVDYDQNQGRSRAAALFSLGQRLKALSTEFNTPVICLNQVSDHVDDNPGANLSGRARVIPALGLAWSSCVNTRLFLSRREGHLVEADEGATAVVVREARIILAAHLPAKSRLFVVQAGGVRAWDDGR